uniref:Neuronal growth regulator 1 n=1 Tax=Aceria tosichella TaxID=561515 RepID=A0A6G1S477_9ACAR
MLRIVPTCDAECAMNEMSLVIMKCHNKRPQRRIQRTKTTTTATRMLASCQKLPPNRRSNNYTNHCWKITAALLIIVHLGPHLQHHADRLIAEAGGGPLDNGLASFSAQNRQQVSFAEPESANNHQTVAVGRSVRFKCVVNNIGDHKIAWFHRDRHILLAIGNKTVAWRERIQVSSQADSVFVLQIDSVQLSDKGHYICQLNTQPLKSQTHILDVVKPPQIREQETTINIEPVKEFSPAELRCVADGIPEPVIKWRRESQTFELPIFDDIEADNNELDDRHEQEQRMEQTRAGDRLQQEQQQEQSADTTSLDSSLADGLPLKLPPTASASRQKRHETRSQAGADSNSVLAGPNGTEATTATSGAPQGVTSTGNASTTKPFIGEGEVLRIDRVSRYDMGYYMCIASNGVPPSVSQRIFLPVSYVSPPKGNNQTNSLTRDRSRETNAGVNRPIGVQDNNNNHNNSGTISMANQDKSVKVRERTNLAHHQTADRTTPAAAGRADSSWVGSGRSYQRNRQLKAARSSASPSSSSASSSSAASAAGSFRASTTGSLITSTTSITIRALLFATLGMFLTIYISSSSATTTVTLFA